MADVLKLAVVQYLRWRTIDGDFDASQSVGLDGDDHELLDAMAYCQNSSDYVIFHNANPQRAIVNQELPACDDPKWKLIGLH